MTAGVSVEAVSRFEAELRRFVARRVPGPDADDVLQDVLLRIHLGVGALRAQERLAPWVYRVARSAIIDHQRRRRLPGADSEPPELAVEPPEEDVHDLLTGCVAPFLGHLPPEQAEALRLTDLGGLTQAEAAARLDVPLPTLKARVRRGRSRLREQFEKCCSLARDARGTVVEANPRCGCG